MTISKLSSQTCKPCEGTEKPMDARAVARYLDGLDHWALTDEGKRLFRELTAKDFMDAVRLIGKIALIAEEQGHHPDLHLTGYKRLRIDLSTHAIGGLSENDFVMAAKINESLNADITGLSK